MDVVFFFKQKTAYEIYQCDWSSDVCSSDLETLSRTILTSGTTLLVVAVLFFFGGAVIHGFSFALLVGIVSGTYSSIYIASPILLIFKKPIDIGGNLEASNDKEISKQDKITDQRQKKSPANKSKRKRSQKVAYKV